MFCIGFLLSACVLCIAAETPSFQWLESSLADNAQINVCPGENTTLLWNFTESNADTPIDIQWYFQAEGQARKVIGTLVDGHFFSDDDHVQFVAPAGLYLPHAEVKDMGVYSVHVNSRNSSGFSVLYTRSAALRTIAQPQITGSRLYVRQRAGVSRDETTGDWYVQLTCGNFTSLGDPPVTVQWQAPSGLQMNSSTFDNGSFVLNIFDPVETGSYSCHVNNNTIITLCLDAHHSLPRDAVLRVDGKEAKLQILEAKEKFLTSQVQQLKEEGENQTHRLHQLQSENTDLRTNNTAMASKLQHCNGGN